MVSSALPINGRPTCWKTRHNWRQLKNNYLETTPLLPEIQNAVIETHATCNNKGYKTRITGNTESKNVVRCTSCNRSMLVNCYLEINTSFQLEKDEKQFNVMANQNTISSYLNENVFHYKGNVDELTKSVFARKHRLQLSKNGQMITDMVDHQDKPDENPQED